jgi:hypothetical protein
MVRVACYNTYPASAASSTFAFPYQSASEYGYASEPEMQLEAIHRPENLGSVGF